MNIEFLRESLAIRPLAEAIDAIKFLYQSEFGCGHLLPGEAACAAHIAREIAQIPQAVAESAFEPIGDGLCRIRLTHPLVRALPPVRIARMMRVTENRVNGSLAGFETKLAMLFSLCEPQPKPPSAQRDVETPSPSLPFTAKALRECLAARSGAPLDPPGHSERYRAAYRPAYRVVLRAYGEALPLIAALDAKLTETGRACLVLDGDCASGKTTLANLLAPLYGATVFHMDDFFLPFSMRTPERLAQPGGNVHYERFLTQVLNGLLSNKPFTYDAFHCHDGSTASVAVGTTPVAIIEGSYALHPAFHQVYEELQTVRALMRVAPEEQLRRIALRNGTAMLERFRNEWIPLEKRYLQAYHSAQAGTLTLVSERHAEDERATEVTRDEGAGD